MALITLNYVFTVGTTIVASQTNLNNTTIYNDYNGNITDVNISSSAAIEYTKLALTGTIKQSDILSTFNNNSGFGMVPSGGIIMWSGSIASIPTGWYLCNGSNGTPDLRNKFIVAADADVGGVAKSTVSGVAAQSGGSTTIALGNLPTGLIGGSSNHFLASGSDFSTPTGSVSGSGTAYVQPYFALAYIQKS